MSKTFVYILQLFIAISFTSFTTTAHCSVKTSQAFAADYLQGESGVSGVRLAYRKYAASAFESKYLGSINLYWEFSANVWEFDGGSHNGINRTIKNKLSDTNYALAISPVFSSQFATILNKYPLRWEFGIGMSLVDKRVFAGKNMGSHYQFEDRLGLTLDINGDYKKSVSIRLFHYSNGGLNERNPGLDFISFSYSMNF